MSSLLNRLAQHAAERPDAPAYSAAAAGSISWRELASRAAAVADALRQQLSPGAVVILSCGNQLEYPIAFLGILAAGCTAFPIYPTAAGAELLRAAKDSSAVSIIGDDRAMRLLGPSVKFVLPITSLPSGGHSAIDQNSTGDLLLQSSGTTGEPKILRRTGASLDTVASAMVEAIGFRSNDRVLMTIPLTHSYGLEHGLLAPVWAGSAVYLSGLMQISSMLPELKNATILPGVPSTFEMLAASSESEAAAPMMRIAYSAGGPLPRSVFDAFANRFGVRVSQLYGASEIGSVTYNEPQDPFDAASVGLPMRGVSIRILDLDTTTDDGDHREGHIAVRAPSMFSGYLNAIPELIDGHFQTGDIGYLDDTGRLFITGRLKLLIDVGGLKVNPLEVESVLLRHPAVEACVVVPLRQSQTVLRLKAIVTPRAGLTTVPIDELRELARQNLSAHKIPRVFEVRDSLPRSPTGKVLRHLIETR
jgi:acyl-CoA synthetase (AMP-forming)/AMP-acid ligase II